MTMNFKCKSQNVSKSTFSTSWLYSTIFQLILDETADVQAHGFYGLKNATSTWTPTNTSLPGPVLNISAFYIDEQAISYGLYGRDWIDPRYNTTPFKSWKNMAYMYENEIYNINYLEDQNGAQCQQDSVCTIFQSLTNYANSLHSFTVSHAWCISHFWY